MSKHRVPYQWDGLLVDFKKVHWADGTFQVSVTRVCDGLDVVDVADMEINLNWSVPELSEVSMIVRAAIWEIMRTYRTDEPNWRDIPPATAQGEAERLF